jgi:RNA-directed DNA polymerase
VCWVLLNAKPAKTDAPAKAGISKQVSEVDRHREAKRILPREEPTPEKPALAARDGRTRPETFDFLGFTHITSVSRDGRFQLKRRTSRKKRVAKLAKLQDEMRKRRHSPVREQRDWLASVLRGHYRYYGVPMNYRALQQFRSRVRHAWHRQLQLRSQRARWSNEQRDKFERHWPLPLPRIHHPWPSLTNAGP